EDGIRDSSVTEVQTCALPIFNTDPYSEGSTAFYHEVTTRPISLDLAHRRLGHISEARVRALANGQAESLRLIPRYKSYKCDHYKIGRASSSERENIYIEVQSS